MIDSNPSDNGVFTFQSKTQSVRDTMEKYLKSQINIDEFISGNNNSASQRGYINGVSKLGGNTS